MVGWGSPEKAYEMETDEEEEEKCEKCGVVNKFVRFEGLTESFICDICLEWEKRGKK